MRYSAPKTHISMGNWQGFRQRFHGYLISDGSQWHLSDGCGRQREAWDCRLRVLLWVLCAAASCPQCSSHDYKLMDS